MINPAGYQFSLLIRCDTIAGENTRLLSGSDNVDFMLSILFCLFGCGKFPGNVCLGQLRKVPETLKQLSDSQHKEAPCRLNINSL